jgi:hypothetical protein
MSIFKETFQDFVFNQLNIREAIFDVGRLNTPELGNRLLGVAKTTLKDGTSVTLPPGAFYTNTTSRQCVIRMSSGVDLKEDNTLLEVNEKEKGNLAGEGLAIRYMLEGGIPAKDIDFTSNRGSDKGSKENPIKVIPRGRGTRQFTKGGSKSNQYGSAYGDPYINSDAKDGFGIVPMPGIIDAEIRTKTAYGSLRDAKINFVCHNRRQLDVLETLYMRPGMPILLEWGWDPYISNDGKRESYFPYLWEWFDQNSSINDINKTIHTRIKAAGGNYDGFVGYVKNFEITSRPDGGYDCTTELAAMGEVLEGLKGKNDQNTLLDKDGKEYEVDNLEFYLNALRDYCEFFSDERSGGYLLNNKRIKSIDAISKNIIPLIPTTLPLNSEEFNTTLTSSTSATDEQLNYINNMEDILDKYLLYKNESIETGGEDASIYGTSKRAQSSFHYIKWELLSLILNGLVFDTYQEGAKTSPITEISWEDEQEPIIGPKQPLKYSKFNFKNGESVTFNRTSKGGNQEVTTTFSDLLDMSVDPTKCLLPHQLNKLVKGTEDSSNKDSFSIVNTENNRYISDIYINLDYLLDLYKRTKYKGDEINEDFNLFTFLQTIWEKDINNACAGTHEFTLHTEKTRGNVVRVIDMHKSNISPKDLYTFKIQGKESIVRDFNYNTTIDSKLSSTVAIASQSPDSISDLDAVSFAAFNRNIQSRFFKEKTPDNKKDRETQKKKAEKYDTDLKNLEEKLGYLYDFKIDLLKGRFTNSDGKIDSEKLSVSKARGAIKSINSKVISLKSRYSKTIEDEDVWKGFRKRNNNPNQSTVIPLKFNAQIDGIGGLVIGNVFKIDNLFLPKSYQEDDIAFVVMTENQKITAGQDWTTDFSGQMLLLDSITEGEHEDILNLREKSTIQTGNISQNSNNVISVEQQTLDPGMEDENLGEVYLKINNELTNIRTGAVVDNSGITRGGLMDNIIGNFPSGNQGLLLGTIVKRSVKDKEPRWIGRIAGDSISDKQKDILGYGGIVTFTGGETRYERISTKAPVYNGVLSNTNGSGGQPGLAYLNKDWGMTKKVDDYYLIQEGQKYAFEQMVAESWFLIEFNENALSKIDVDTISTNNFINNNQAWMRLDVLQSTP